MGERSLPALKVSELHIFARKVRTQLLAAQLGRFGQHPSLLLDNPLTGLDFRQRKWWLNFLDELSRGCALTITCLSSGM